MKKISEILVELVSESSSETQQERAAARVFAGVSQHWDQTRVIMQEFLRHPGAKSLIDARDLADFTQAQGRMEDLLARISQNIDAIR